MLYEFLTLVSFKKSIKRIFELCLGTEFSMVSEMIPHVFLQFSSMYSYEMALSELATIKSEYLPDGGGTWEEAEACGLQSRF